MANELVAKVTSKIIDMQNNEGLTLPEDYSVGNALNSAWLELSDDSKGPSLLSKVDQGSVSKALLNMAIQGLSPAKNQVYFIPYGKQLTMIRSYFGAMTVLKRLKGVKNIGAEVIHEDDEFEIGSEDDRTVVTNFKPSFANLDKPIIGAFAVITKDDGRKVYTVMTKKEIDQSWSHAKTTKVQKEFPQEMTKRTVINRAAKYYINSSTDNETLIRAVNETTEAEYDNSNRKDVTPEKTSVKEFLKAPKPEPKPVPNTDTKPAESRKEVKTDDKPARTKSQTSKPAETKPVTKAKETNIFDDPETAPF
jgi:recombination protein RecT